MVGLLRKLRRNTTGMTTIEYGLLAGIMGTGIAVSMNYVTNEFSSFVSTHVGCNWEDSDSRQASASEDANASSGAKCVMADGSGWSARRPAKH